MHDGGLGLSRGGQRRLARHGDIGSQAAVEPVDAVEIGPRQLDRGDLLAADQVGLARSALIDEVVAHAGRRIYTVLRRGNSFSALSRSMARRSLALKP